MKALISVFTFFYSCLSFAQSVLPFNYEQNLPLLGNPTGVSEYYYEYHSQTRAHFYEHTMEYDGEGRIIKHTKTNKDLLNPDSIPADFKDIVDLRPITVTYSFTYDTKSRYAYFIKNQFQKEVGSYQQDEEWKYDEQDMIINHNYYSVDSTGKILKSPSFKRNISRDDLQRVEKIEKLTYSYSDKGLILSEITLYKYLLDDIDTVLTYKLNNGNKVLTEKKYNISVKRYTPLNTDSILYNSYLSEDGSGQIAKHYLLYDQYLRDTLSLATDLTGDTITITNIKYEPFKITETTDGSSLVSHYDTTGYETYEETFNNGYSLGVPPNMNTRTIVDNKISKALLEIWDPVTLFYRKDTEYFYFYNGLTSVSMPDILPGIKIYPNPSSGSFSFENSSSISSIQLLMEDGRSIALPVSQTIHTNVPPGIYMLYIIFQNSTSQKTKISIE